MRKRRCSSRFSFLSGRRNSKPVRALFTPKADRLRRVFFFVQSVPSIFRTTCIFRAAHTSAVTEIHNTIKSLIRFFLFIVTTSIHENLFDPYSLPTSEFREEFRLMAAIISAARETHRTINSLLKIFFIIRDPPLS